MSHPATPDSPEVWGRARAMTGTDALESLDTEQRGPSTTSTGVRRLELVELMAEEDALVPAAVARAAPQIAQGVDDVVERPRAVSAHLRRRRLVRPPAAVDAYECETTFSMPSGTVVAIVAGGGGRAPSRRRPRTMRREMI